VTPYEQYVERERGYVRKALELLGDVPSAYNMAPVVDLIRIADSLGVDVVKRSDGKCNLQPRASHNTED
jgi:hypothetical protein